MVFTILALFVCADIKNFYYNTPMVNFEYMKLPLSMSPQEIIDQYNLKDLVAADGNIYMDIRRGVPGIKQSGRLSSVTCNLTRSKIGRVRLHVMN